jgi:hypothetical protein
MTSKQFLMDLFWRLLGWGFSFALIYWLATDNLWLCFFISGAANTASFAMADTKKTILEMILPMAQSNDDHINSLIEKTQFQEEQIDELRDLVVELQNRLDELENA